MLQYNTPKLFYGKYPYKLTFRSLLANNYRGGDLSNIRQVLDGLQLQYVASRQMTIQTWRHYESVTPADLHLNQKVFRSLVDNQGDFKIRVEARVVQIYSESRQWLHDLGTSIQAHQFWEPQGSLKPNEVIMTDIMSDWGYRITLGREVPKEFRAWAKNNFNKIKCGPRFTEELLGHDAYALYLNNLYFYVKNEKMLNLVTLVAGNGIVRVDKIIIAKQNA